jgi:hypothetical protein
MTEGDARKKLEEAAIEVARIETELKAAKREMRKAERELVVAIRKTGR